MKIRNEKIDMWHRQFENMTIEENGIIRIVSDFEVLEHSSDSEKVDPEGKVNMLFATSFIKSLIDQYQGRV